MNKPQHGGRRSLSSEAGSFTLEASIVFPAVFAAVVILLLAGLFVYERTLLYYSASAAAERAAFRWDNSHRDAVTGIAPAGRYDGLYWRLTDDRLLQSLFGFAEEAEHAAAAVAIKGGGRDVSGGTDGTAEDGLPEAKLRKAAARVSGRYQGEAALSRHPLLKEVNVRLMLPGAADGLPKLTGFRTLEASAAAPIADPVELIRTVDLVRYYAAKFGGGPSAADKRTRAGTVVRNKAGQSTRGAA